MWPCSFVVSHLCKIQCCVFQFSQKTVSFPISSVVSKVWKGYMLYTVYEIPSYRNDMLDQRFQCSTYTQLDKMVHQVCMCQLKKSQVTTAQFFRCGIHNHAQTCWRQKKRHLPSPLFNMMHQLNQMRTGVHLLH